MRRQIRTMLVVLACVCLTGSMAYGKSSKSSRRRIKKLPNMPPGWVWPPSAEMKRTGKRCLKRLDKLGVKYKKARRRRKINTPIYVDKLEFSGVKFVPLFRKPPFVMDCHFAEVFARTGKVMHDAGIRELHFSTIYRYRNVRLGGKVLNALSRHSLGLAMDVYKMVDKRGRKFDVKRDYRKGVFAKVERALHRSRAFRRVFTPGNERSHDDHFHFEAKMNIGKRHERTVKYRRQTKRRKRKQRPSRRSRRRPRS